MLNHATLKQHKESKIMFPVTRTMKCQYKLDSLYLRPVNAISEEIL